MLPRFTFITLLSVSRPYLKEKQTIFIKMSVYIAGFICALVLAALVVIWIGYCMFVRERHKSEYYQYNISDIQYRNNVLSQNQDKANEKEVSSGIFILPSRRQRKYDDYIKRPDYPESPAPTSQPSSDKLIEIFKDDVIDADVHYKDGIYEVDCSPPYHSDV